MSKIKTNAIQHLSSSSTNIALNDSGQTSVSDLLVSGQILVATDKFTVTNEGVVTAQGKIKSELSSGSMPFEVTSTTMCVNLNADKVDGCDVGASANPAGDNVGKLVTVGTGTGQIDQSLLGDALPSGDIVGTDAVQTLTNKQINDPYLNFAAKSGTLTRVSGATLVTITSNNHGFLVDEYIHIKGTTHFGRKSITSVTTDTFTYQTPGETSEITNDPITFIHSAPNFDVDSIDGHGSYNGTDKGITIVSDNNVVAPNELSHTVLGKTCGTAAGDEIVTRDSNGNFSAGTITADLTGTATKATDADKLKDPEGNYKEGGYYLNLDNMIGEPLKVQYGGVGVNHAEVNKVFASLDNSNDDFDNLSFLIDKTGWVTNATLYDITISYGGPDIKVGDKIHVESTATSFTIGAVTITEVVPNTSITYQTTYATENSYNAALDGDSGQTLDIKKGPFTFRSLKLDDIDGLTHAAAGADGLMSSEHFNLVAEATHLNTTSALVKRHTDASINVGDIRSDSSNMGKFTGGQASFNNYFELGHASDENKFTLTLGDDAVLEQNGDNLTVAGDITAFKTPSDIRIKKNIKDVGNSLIKVMNLRPVEFEYKKDCVPNHPVMQGRQIGLIAQEVKKIVPEAVREKEDGKFTIQYEIIIPLLIKAIQELAEYCPGQMK